jgi:YVTN family beta-propeller protein
MFLAKSLRALFQRPAVYRHRSRSHSLPRRLRRRPLLERLEDRTTPSLVLLSSISLGNQPPGEAAVNPNTDRVYIGSGFGPGPMTVVNASDPTAPTVVTTHPTGWGATVNPTTNRYYTSSGYGGQILVFDGVHDTQLTAVPIGYCPGYFDVDSGRNLIYAASQCGGGNDPVHVLFDDGATQSIVAGPLGSGGVMGAVHVNTATGNIYADNSGGTRVFTPSYTFLTDLSAISMHAANPVTNRLYFASGSDLQVRDGTTHALLATIPGAGTTGSVGVDTSRNRAYVANSGNRVVQVIDGVTNTVVESVSLGPNETPWQVAVDTTKDRIYVVGSDGSGTRLFVYQDAALTATGTTLSATVGQRFAAVVASFTDSGPNPGAATDYSAVVDWGDHSPLSTGGISDDGGGSYDVAASHTYYNSGTYSITITITDNRDLTRTATALSSADVTAPSSFLQESSHPSGTATVTDGPLTDAGGSSRFGNVNGLASVPLGNGSPPSASPLDQLFTSGLNVPSGAAPRSPAVVGESRFDLPPGAAAAAFSPAATDLATAIPTPALFETLFPDGLGDPALSI